MPDVAASCQERALGVLHECAHPHGFVASSAFGHYAAVWARDAVFTMTGALATGDAALADASRRTLLTLAERASPLGQIPDVVWPERALWDWGEVGATDATALFVIGAQLYVEATGDTATGRHLLPHLRAALTWLRHQDANNLGLIDSPEGGDWMDSTLSRSGKVLHVNVLYARAARALATLDPEHAAEHRALEESVRARINLLFWPEAGVNYGDLLAHVGYPRHGPVEFPHETSPRAFAAAVRSDREHYVSHVQFGRFADRCDVLANVLAVLFGVAPPARAERILDFLARPPAMEPYPARSWPEPFTPGDDPWQMLKPAAELHQAQRWRNPPFAYHNAAVWPFIGGLYCLALWRAGRGAEADRALTALAAANRLAAEGEWGFHEWIDSRSGEPGGAPHQAWSAGTYVLAYRAIREGLALGL